KVFTIALTILIILLITPYGSSASGIGQTINGKGLVKLSNTYKTAEVGADQQYTTKQTIDIESLRIYDEISSKEARAYAFNLKKQDVIQANFSDSNVLLSFKVIDPEGNKIRFAYVDYNTIIFVAWMDGRFVIQVTNPNANTAIFNATIYKLSATETSGGTLSESINPGGYRAYFINFTKTSQASVSLTGTYGTNYDVYIFDSKGNLHTYSNKTTYPDEVDFAVIYPKPYYIIIYEKRGAETGSAGINIVITDPYELSIGSTATEELDNPTSTVIYQLTTTKDAIYKLQLYTPNSYLNKTVYNDDLEGDTSKWETTGNWSLTNLDYHSASHSWNISGAGASNLTTIVDLTLAKGGEAKLIYWQKQDITSPLYIQISSDGGATWTNKATINYDSLNWEKKIIDISTYLGEKIKIRFFYQGSHTTDFWRIDDIKVVAVYGGTRTKMYNSSLALKYTIDTAFQGNTYTNYTKYFVSPTGKKYYIVINPSNATQYTLTITKYADITIKTSYFSYNGGWKWFALYMPEGTRTYISADTYTEIYAYDEDMNLILHKGYYGSATYKWFVAHKSGYLILKLYASYGGYRIHVYTPERVSTVSPGTIVNNITFSGGDFGFYVNAIIGEQLRLTLTGPSGSDADIYVYFNGVLMVKSKSTWYPDRLIFAPIQSGLYLVKIHSKSGSGSFTVTYTKEAIPVLQDPATQISEELSGYFGIVGYKFLRSSDGNYYAHLTLDSQTIYDLSITIYDPSGEKLLVHESWANYPTEVSFNTYTDGEFIILISSRTWNLANYTLTFQAAKDEKINPGTYSSTIGSSVVSSVKSYEFNAPIGSIISVDLTEGSGTTLWVEGFNQKGLVESYDRTNSHIGQRKLRFASPLNGTAFVGIINKGSSGSYTITIKVQLTILNFGRSYDFTKPIISDITQYPKDPLPTNNVTVRAAIASLTSTINFVKLNWTKDEITWITQDMTQIEGGAYYESVIPPQPAFTRVKYKIVAVESDGDKTETEIFTYNVTIIDNEPPSVRITSPENGSVLSSSSVVLSWNASDDLSGLDRFEIYVDGVLNATLQADQLSYQLSLGVGDHVIRVVAYDKAGNSAYDEIVIKVDVEPPSVRITSPENGSVLSSSSVVLSWNASDDLSGLDRFEIYVDGVLNATLQADQLSYQLSLGVGDHVIRVVAYDKAGNSAYDEIVIKIEFSKPGGSSLIGPIGIAGILALVGVVSLLIFIIRRRK
ncbi:MAG: Ig-like domain-containing protein, partial [Candidatus Njordarchaeia archaeon]